MKRTKKFQANFEKADISHSKILKLVKIVSQGPGIEFWPSFALLTSLVAHIHFAHCCCSGRAKLFDSNPVVFTVVMSESDEFAYTEESSSSESGSESSSSDEIEVVGIVQPYAEEPLAHSSDEGEDDEADHDGLTPATLRARYLKAK